MASSEDLKTVLKDALQNRGVLGEMKAKLRAEVYKALDDNSVAKPTLTHENYIINELIREYLDFNQYKYTSSVLSAESSQPNEPLDRDFLAHELNIRQTSENQQIPLLYSIVTHLMSQSRKVTDRDATSTEYVHSSRHIHVKQDTKDHTCVDHMTNELEPKPLIVEGKK